MTRGLTLDKAGITSEATDRYDQRFGWERVGRHGQKRVLRRLVSCCQQNTDGITEILRRVYDRN